MAIQEPLVSEKKYVLVAPDGGWGYMICVAAILNFVALTSFVPCFGIIYNDFFIELGMGSKDVSLLTGVFAVSAAISGFMAGPLLKIMSMRKLAFVGSTLATAGTLGTAFVKTEAQLFLCQGILQNCGMGIMFTVTSTALNDYFVQKRLVFLSLVNTVTAVVSMVAPLGVEWSKAVFGFRGTLIIIGAISSLTFVGSSLLQPVAWHMKKVEEDIDHVTEVKLLLEKLNDETSEETPVIKLKDVETVDDLFPGHESVKEKPTPDNRVLTLIKNSLDWPLLKDFLVTCTCFGIPICIFTETTFVTFLPQYLYALNWSNESVALAFSLQGFGDIATRLLLMFSNPILKRIGAHLMYVIGLAIGITTMLALLWVSDHNATLVIMTISGITRCTVTVLFPIVIAESTSAQLFPSAIGISMGIFGFSSIILGPLLGILRDVTGDYATMFYALAAILTTVAVAITGEVMFKRRRTSREERRVNKD